MNEDNVSSNWCKKCNILVCGWACIEEANTHLWCVRQHLVCFKDNDDENPCKKNDHSYKPQTWLCPKCKGKK